MGSLVTLLLLGLVASPDAASPLGPDVDPFVRASGLCLAEVVALEERDSRPMDGNLDVTVKLKNLRSTGVAPETLTIAKALGGLRPPGGPEEPWGPLRHDDLRVGGRYWFLLCSRHEYSTYPQGVMRWWPHDSPATPELDRLVAADAYRRRPQYDPTTGLTYDRLSEPDKDRLTVRVLRSGRLLWERALPGPMADHYMGLYFSPGAGAGPLYWADESVPLGVLVATVSTRLPEGNDFGLTPGPYYVAYTYRAEDGALASVRVSDAQPSDVERFFRAFDLKTGRRVLERQTGWMKSGGRAVGAAEEAWFRKVETRFDPAAGRQTRRDVFRFTTGAGGSTWVPVAPPG